MTFIDIPSRSLIVLCCAALFAAFAAGFLAGRAERVKSEAEADALIHTSYSSIGRVVAEHLHAREEPTP